MDYVEIVFMGNSTKHLYKDPSNLNHYLVYPTGYGLHVKDPETRVVTVYPWCHIDYYKYQGD